MIFKNKGQATLEYILLLVIAAGLGLILLTDQGLASRIGSYSNSLIGVPEQNGNAGGDKSYYACLMEFGLLPGGEIGDGNNTYLTDCGKIQQEASADIRSGSANRGGQGSYGSSSSSSSSSSSRRNSRNGSSNSNFNQKPIFKASSSGLSSSGSKTKKSRIPGANSRLASNQNSQGRGRNSPYKFKTQAKKAKKSQAGGDSSEIIIKDHVDKDDGYEGQGPLSFRFKIEKDKKKQAASPKIQKASGADKAQKSKDKQASAGDPEQVRKTASVEEKQEEWNLTALMKWLFIVIMIIAVIVIIGFQFFKFQQESE